MDKYKINMTIHLKAETVNHVWILSRMMMKLIQSNFRENIIGYGLTIERDDDGI